MSIGNTNFLEGGVRVQESRILLRRVPRLNYERIGSQTEISRLLLWSSQDTQHVVSGRSKMQILQAASAQRPRGLRGLSGASKILMQAYNATGRIGFPQIGNVTRKDASKGTGVLITPNHVLINRHVFKHPDLFFRSNNKRQAIGIEFGAEKGSKRSYFQSFSGRFKFLEGYDLVVLSLNKAETKRRPVAFDFSKADKLEDVGVAVIGYPDPNWPDNSILSVVEGRPLWAVKRISTGKVFRHATDEEGDITINVDSSYSDKKRIRSICHSASTAGGSSGSPLIRRDNGKVCAIHYGYDRALNYDKPANFAMPAISFRRSLQNLGIKL